MQDLFYDCKTGGGGNQEPTKQVIEEWPEDFNIAGLSVPSPADLDADAEERRIKELTAISDWHAMPLYELTTNLREWLRFNGFSIPSGVSEICTDHPLPPEFTPKA